MRVLLLVLMCGCAHAEQIQTCKALAPAGYTGQTLIGCPIVNLLPGPATTADLVRATLVLNGPQVWIPFSSLTPDSWVVSWTTGKWTLLSSIPLSPTPTSASLPTPQPIPTVDYTQITSYTLERSADAGKTWDAVSVTISYPSQSTAQCFRITPYRSDGPGPPIISCPVPK